jgi:hypothetical protein
MKRLALVPFAIACLGISAAALTAEGPDTPPGVAAKHWVPISARLGVVLVEAANTPARTERGALMLRPPVNGYFMVKGADGWTRLIIVEPSKGPADVG